LLFDRLADYPKPESPVRETGVAVRLIAAADKSMDFCKRSR